MDGVLYAPIFANRRVALAGQHMFQYMTMASLLAWRATCRDTYLVSTKELRQSLHTLLTPFTPDPVAFLRYLTTWGAIIVGEAALAHVLHNSSISTHTLELAVGNLVFEPFIRRITTLHPFEPNVPNPIETPVPLGFPFLRHITRIYEFHLASGVTVVVYESPTPSACDVVCGAWTTALMNFVTESSFGCAYPRLTLNLQGVLCDGRMAARWHLDNLAYDNLKAHGFQFSLYSSTWSTYSKGPYSTISPPTGGCGKTAHVCPSQGRYFGDRGSLVLFSDGFCTNLDHLRNSCIPPYGPMAIWRIPSKVSCNEGCFEDESVLPAYVITMLIQFVDGDSRSFVHLSSQGNPRLPSPFTNTIHSTKSVHTRRHSV